MVKLGGLGSVFCIWEELKIDWSCSNNETICSLLIPNMKSFAELKTINHWTENDFNKLIDFTCVLACNS